MMPYMLEYPVPSTPSDTYSGVVPIDFVLETVLAEGLAWFKSDPQAPLLVYGHLAAPWLSKYGTAKAYEIQTYLKKYEIKIVQSFALIDAQLASISIQLIDGGESVDRSGLADHQRMADTLGSGEDVLSRQDVGYVAMTDTVHIGVHNVNTPDLTKYLYYLIVYILSSSKKKLEDRGLMLGTFRTTDISRLNDFLPENMYSRFINFSVFSIASFSNGSIPIVDSIQLDSINGG